MKLLFILLPVVLGAFAVFQARLNRKISSNWGLSSAALLNSSVLIIAAVSLFFYTLMADSPMELFKVKLNFKTFQWWYVLPGIFGFCLVIGIPWSISQLGALNTFLVIIAVQLIVSGAWDLMMENVPLTPLRITGAGLAFVGAFLAVRG